MLTEAAVPGAADAPLRVSVFPSFEFNPGLENGLNISDGSFLAADRLPTGFSTFLGPSSFVSGATAVFGLDLVDLAFDKDASNGLTPFLCSLIESWLLLLPLSINGFVESFGCPIDGRLPVRRYVPDRQD